MKNFEFRAVKSGKQEAMIGFAFAAMLMVPLLAIWLGLYYSGLDNILKSNPSALLKLGFALVVMAIIYASFYFIGRIQDKLVKKYTVVLNGTNIRIFENGKDILSGSVSACKIVYKTKGNSADSVSCIIDTDTGKIAFRLRSREWKNIMGSSQPNPFGTSDIRDIETVLDLEKAIHDMIERSVSAKY